MDIWIYSAFLVGFLGSFHCAGMCGPIALALPLADNSRWSILAGRTLYNAGRVITYSLLGLIIGLFGHTIALAGYQGLLSIVSGVLILAAVLLPLAFKRLDALSRFSSMYGQKIKRVFRTIFGVKSKLNLLLIGLVNGFLPCGFVYLALAGAVASGSLTNSVLYMTFFGLGTIPMMLSLSMIGTLGGPSLRRFVLKASPYVAVSVAILLIIRGFMVGPVASCH
ncbi:MAG: sulfite exporter TauE/SafE family protein [Bacteroidia bacterium]|nr:sulfite exporter TauE/SafE family protein [Bacteroidia bacterium]